MLTRALLFAAATFTASAAAQAVAPKRLTLERISAVLR